MHFGGRSVGSGAASMLARLRCRTGNVTMYIVTLPVTERCKGVPGGNVRKNAHTYLRHRLCNSVGCYVTGDREVYAVVSPVTKRCTSLHHRYDNA